jgi:hypothetical protein
MHADHFEVQSPITVDDTVTYVAQVASPRPVKPAARLVVEPGDFPFLAQIHGHKDDLVRARRAADPDGLLRFEEP